MKKKKKLSTSLLLGQSRHRITFKAWAKELNQRIKALVKIRCKTSRFLGGNNKWKYKSQDSYKHIKNRIRVFQTLIFVLYRVFRTHLSNPHQVENSWKFRSQTKTVFQIHLMKKLNKKSNMKTLCQISTSKIVIKNKIRGRKIEKSS